MNVTITVERTEPPAPGKKRGKVFDTTGKMWLVYEEKLPLYRQGESYLITKASSNAFSGRTYYTITEMQPVSGNYGAGGGRAATQAATAYDPRAREREEQNRSMHIFICGAFNNIMSNPQVNPLMMSTDDMIQTISQLKTAWHNTLGGGQKPSDDMNDEIPF